MRSSNYWLVVMGRADAIEWAVSTNRLAFRSTVKEAPTGGDSFAIYATTSVLGTGKRSEPKLVAMGAFEDDGEERSVEIGGETFGRQYRVRFEKAMPIAKGIPFRPLIESMEFIKSKRGWAAYVHRSLVPLSPHDFARIRAHMGLEV